MMRNRVWRRSPLLILFGLLLLVISGCAQEAGDSGGQAGNNPPASEASEDRDDAGEVDLGDEADDYVGADAEVDRIDKRDDATESADADDDEASDDENPGSVQAVNIADSAFQPGSLLVEAGTKVVWTNQDNVNHQVHADDDAYQLGVIGKGGQVEVDYNAPGTFDYHCHLHPFMQGRIIVE